MRSYSQLMKTAVPITKPGVVAEEFTTTLPRYRVLLHNDDRNTMEHVVRTLMAVFKFERDVCERIMWEAHTTGVALCAVEPLEQAELHRDQLQSSSLTATIEPE